MPNYQNGKIYCLRSHQTDDIYIGSTTQSLAKRKGGHFRDYKCYLNDKHNYMTSFKLCEYVDMYIELIENYPCNSKEELHKREGHFIRTMDCVNKCIAGRCTKQYRIDNSDKIKEKKKEYYEDNADKIKERTNQYRIDNADKIKERMKQYRIDNADKIKEKKKQYYEDNADKIKEQTNQYRIDNKDKIKEKKKQYYENNKEKRKETVVCECGTVVRKDSLNRHKKTKKHIKLMEEQH